MRRLGAALVTVVAASVAAGAVTACQPDTVDLTFRPAAGARYTYRIEVSTSSVTRIEGAPERRSEETVTFTAEHTVLRASSAQVEVEIRLTRTGSTPRVFQVTLDRAAQLTAVERVDGLPTQLLGDIGLSEIFPAAAGAPPARRLRAGERWTVDEPLSLAGSAPSRLTGQGRLVALGREHGQDRATVRTHTNLALAPAPAAVALAGSEDTDATVVRDVADGSVVDVEATTTARFGVDVAPPSGTGGPPAHGEVTVELRSRTTRV